MYDVSTDVSLVEDMEGGSGSRTGRVRGVEGEGVHGDTGRAQTIVPSWSR